MYGDYPVDSAARGRRPRRRIGNRGHRVATREPPSVLVRMPRKDVISSSASCARPTASDSVGRIARRSSLVEPRLERSSWRSATRRTAQKLDFDTFALGPAMHQARTTTTTPTHSSMECTPVSRHIAAARFRSRRRRHRAKVLDVDLPRDETRTSSSASPASHALRPWLQCLKNIRHSVFLRQAGELFRLRRGRPQLPLAFGHDVAANSPISSSDGLIVEPTLGFRGYLSIYLSL